MRNIRDLFDDFETISIDESKWGNWGGDVTILPKGGMRLGVGSAANQYSAVSSSELFDLTGGSAFIGVDSMVSDVGTATAGFYLVPTDRDAFFGITCDGTTISFEVRQGPNTVQLAAAAWNASEMRFWRIRHSARTRVVYYETSRDGQAWVTRAKYTEVGGVTNIRIEFQAGYWDANDPGSGAFTIRYFNTQQTIDRGPGFLSEDFDFMRTSHLPYNVSWGMFRNLDDGGDPSNLRVYEEPTGGKSLRVAAATDVQAVVRTDLKKPMYNIDMAVDVILENNGNRPGGANDSDTPRLAWRVDGGPSGMGFASRYELSIFRDYSVIWRMTPTGSVPLKLISVGTEYGVRYRWRIIHVGSEIVVYRSLGDHSQAPSIRYNRITEAVGPSITSTSGWRASGGALSVVDDGGRNVMKYTKTSETSAANYMDPPASDNMSPPVGSVVRFSLDLKVTAPTDNIRLQIPSYAGAARTGGVGEFVSQTPEDGWVRHSIEAVVTAMPDGGYLRTLVWPSNGAVPTGEGFMVRNVLREIDTDGPFFDRYSTSGNGKTYDWDSSISAHSEVTQPVNGWATPLIPLELGRTRDELEPLAAGQVAFIGFSSAARYDNLHIAPARALRAVERTSKMKSRKWGAFAARGEVQVVDGEVIRPVEMMQDTSALYDLEDLAGKKFDIASWFAPDNGPFPLEQALEFAERGKQNLISWGPERIHWDRIIAGDLNPLLDEFIDCIKQLPTQTVLRLMPEMNGEWSPWSTHYNSGAEFDPARTLNFTNFDQYIQTWRYIVDYFRDNGSDAKFLFCINETDEPRTNVMERYYPGDSHVDLTGFDAYNWGMGGPFQWRPHNEVWEDAYNRLAGLSVRNKIWLCEFSSKEPTKNDGKAGFTPDPTRSPADPEHDKGVWVHDMMEDNTFSRLEALVVFSIDKERDWRIESSTSSLNAYKEGFASAMAPQELIDLDPETYPLPIPAGWEPIHKNGRIEYMRLEEDGYLPLVLEPSYGGIWLAGFDLGYADIRESVTTAAQRNGTFDYTKLRGSKAVSLEFQIVPYLNASVPYMISLLSRWADPRRRPTLVYKPFDGDERRIKLRASQLGREAVINLRDHAEVSLQFVAPDGVEETTTEKRVRVESDSVSVNVKQAGTAECYPKIRLYGPLSNPVVYNETLDSNGDARLGFDTEIAAGQFLEIDVLSRSVQLNGWADPAANRRGDLTDRRWFSLVPFTNMIRLEADAGTGHAEIVYHDTWL